MVDGVKVPEHQVTRVNASAIVFHIENAPKMQAIYTCRHNGIGIQIAEVTVGMPPQPVTDFKCISHNWEDTRFQCTFKFEQNPISTKYKLSYGRSGDSFMNVLDLRPNSSVNESGYWFNVPEYSRVIVNYKFILSMSNVLGTYNQTFDVDNYASIRPDKPHIYRVPDTPVLPRSIQLKWDIGYTLHALPSFCFIVCQLNYTSEHNKSKWETIEMSEKPERAKENLKYTLMNLTPHTWYDVRIRVRVSKVTRDELWSEYATYVFHTASTIPDRPPAMDVGAFHVNYLNDVIIYWKQLKPYEENAANASYVVHKSLVNGKPQALVSSVSRIMAKFSNMPNATLEFEVRSANAKGLSEKSSYIKIPGPWERLPYPTELKKNRNGTLYTLSWQRPLYGHEAVDSYTVFWCKSKSELPNQCEVRKLEMVCDRAMIMR